MHGGMLMVDGVKMSKSLGNFYTVDQILEKHPAEALRLLFLTTHYHQPFNFTFEGLEQAKQNLDKFYNALLQVKDVEFDENVNADTRVVEALEDDLNTPLALSHIHDLVNQLNKAETLDDKSKYKTLLIKSAELLGLLWLDPEVWFKGEASDEAKEIEELIDQRATAKKNKDYALADKIRNDLKERGILLEDGVNGTTWKKM
jgi:cysteinyl-tRNA synthetase